MTLCARLLPLAWIASLAACAGPAPERRPLDLERALDELEQLARRPRPAEDEVGARFDLADGLTLEEAASFALTRHPSLKAARAQLGVSRALVVEAGLWPDPTIAWNAVDWLVGGTSDDVLTGWSLNWNNPRPGERKARIAHAKAEESAVRAQLLEAEWRFAREVEAAWMEAAELAARRAMTVRRTAAARETVAFIEEARGMSVATELDASIARLDLAELEFEDAELAAREAQALTTLAERLGLPPSEKLELQEVELFAAREVALDAAVDADALRARPDVALALERYEVAEREVAVAATLRGIAVSYIGTALGVTIPWGSRWGEATLEVALARREQSAREVDATTHRARAEIEGTRRRALRAREVMRVADENFEPLVERLVEIARAARQARSAPAGELLAAQKRALTALDLVVQARWEALRVAREFETARVAPHAAGGMEKR